MPGIDFGGISSALLSSADKFLRQWFPHGHKEGHEFKVGDMSGKKGTSLSINMRTGRWADFATGETGGDLIDLYAAKHGLKVDEAAKTLAGVVGITTYASGESVASKASPPPPEPDADKATPPPADAPSPSSIRGEVPLTKKWAYRNEEGKIVGYVQRFDVDGEKVYRPCWWNGTKWSYSHFPKPRILYNLNELTSRPEAPVIISEGEKCADVAKSFFSSYVSTTWSGGSNAWHLANWAPLKTRKHVLIIPDADEPGIKAAMGIGRLLRSLGVEEVFVVDTSEKPKKWDIADAANAGESIANLMGWLKKNRMSLESFIEKFDSSAPVEAPFAKRSNEPPAPSQPDDGVLAGSDDDMVHNRHFRFLGVMGQEYFFYKYKTSQVFGFRAEELGKEGTLIGLAEKEFWDEHFQGKWNAARSFLVRVSENLRYDPRQNRRVGIWEDDAGNIAHLGDRLLGVGGLIPLNKFNSQHIYEYCEKTIRNSKYRPPLKPEECKKIIDICNGCNWQDAGSGAILAGWLFSSLICGSLRWRSHIYIVGPAGSGKTWLMDNIVGKVLGDFRFKAVGSSTEASIRQGLDSNIVPVIFDECEAENSIDLRRLQSIFDLSRQASSADEDTAIVKGSPTGRVNEYHVRSPFLFASINQSMTQYADQSRTSVLPLKKNEKSESIRTRFKNLEFAVHKTFTDDFRIGLLTRAVEKLKFMQEGFEIFAEAAYHTVAKDVRHAEQMAFMLVGLWFLQFDDLPSPEDAKKFVNNTVYSKPVVSEISTTEDRLMAAIAQSKVRFKLASGTIDERIMGELIGIASREIAGDADAMIRRYGLRVLDGRLYVCNESENLKKLLRETPFHSGWSRILINVTGGRAEPKMNFAEGIVGHAVSIPLKEILGESIKEPPKEVDIEF